MKTILIFAILFGIATIYSRLSKAKRSPDIWLERTLYEYRRDN